MIQTAPEGLIQHPSVRQFVKFCMIGFTSLCIDVGVSTVLLYHFHWPWWIAKTISFLIAVTNGFVWNSLWTFRGLGSGPRHEQYVKFVAVCTVGYFLNLGLMKAVFYVFTGQLIQRTQPDKAHWFAATAVAAVAVSVWNFLANKKWAFAGERAADGASA